MTIAREKRRTPETHQPPPTEERSDQYPKTQQAEATNAQAEAEIGMERETGPSYSRPSYLLSGEQWSDTSEGADIMAEKFVISCFDRTDSLCYEEGPFATIDDARIALAETVARDEEIFFPDYWVSVYVDCYTDGHSILKIESVLFA